MVRLARDLVEITSEIITEKFDDVTIIEMSQTQLPTRQMQQQKMAQIQQMLQQGQQMMQMPVPQGGDPSQGNPQAAQMQQAMQHGAAQLQKIQQEPTIEQVLHFLQDNRAKSFVLDIETDSTIMADENAEKQRRTEFVQVLGGLLPQLSTMIQNEPKTAPFCGEILKFATAPFRSGRSLDGAIDELIEQMKEKADQPQGESPDQLKYKHELQIEQMKQKTIADKNTMDARLKASELMQKDEQEKAKRENERAIKQAELQAKQGDAEGKMQVQNQKAMENREAHQAHMLENQQKMDLDRAKAQMAMNLKQQDHSNKAAAAQMAAQQKAAQRGNGGLV
jgi:hypothetical protein